MPRPKKGETEKDFLKRCIPHMIKEEGYEQKQGIAICYSIYRREGTEKASPKPKKKNNPKKLNKKQKTGLYCAVCN